MVTHSFVATMFCTYRRKRDGCKEAFSVVFKNNFNRIIKKSNQHVLRWRISTHISKIPRQPHTHSTNLLVYCCWQMMVMRMTEFYKQFPDYLTHTHTHTLRKHTWPNQRLSFLLFLFVNLFYIFKTSLIDLKTKSKKQNKNKCTMKHT